jgi:RNA polymerase sigma-70 factor, ECF subfamily
LGGPPFSIVGEKETAIRLQYFGQIGPPIVLSHRGRHSVLRIPLSTARGFIAGDEEAISEVYLSSRKLLYFIIRSIVANKDDADDVYQETFVRILASRAAIKSPKCLERYLTQCAKNAALNFVRERGVRIDACELMDAYGEEDHKNSYLQEFMPFLSDLENAVAVYKIEYGFSFREIAALTGVSRQTADSAYRDALRKIRKNL